MRDRESISTRINKLRTEIRAWDPRNIAVKQLAHLRTLELPCSGLVSKTSYHLGFS
jgi:hypothetical protein